MASPARPVAVLLRAARALRAPHRRRARGEAIRRLRRGRPVAAVEALVGDLLAWPRALPTGGIRPAALTPSTPESTLRLGVLGDEAALVLGPEAHVVRVDSQGSNIEWHDLDLLWLEPPEDISPDMLAELLEAAAREGVPSALVWRGALTDGLAQLGCKTTHVFVPDPRDAESWGSRWDATAVTALPAAVQERFCHPMRRSWQRGHRRAMVVAHAARTSPSSEDLAAIVCSGGEPPLVVPETSPLEPARRWNAHRLHRVELHALNPDAALPAGPLEALVTGTPVIATPHPLLTSWPQAVRVAHDAPQASAALHDVEGTPADDLLRQLHVARREILSTHTVRHRLNTVVQRLGLDRHIRPEPSISVICSTNRPGQLGHILGSLAAQRRDRVEAIIGCHGFVPDAGVRERAAALTLRVRLVELAPDLSLGGCLNQLIARAEGDIVTKMDDDDHYGPHYLTDLAHALTYSGADVVGKWARYIHFEATDTTVLVHPHRAWMDHPLVAGPTLMGARHVFDEIGFRDVGRGEDTGFLRNVWDRGGRVYSSDPFNFVQVRRADAASHTWQASRDDVSSLHGIECPGLPFERIHT